MHSKECIDTELLLDTITAPNFCPCVPHLMNIILILIRQHMILEADMVLYCTANTILILIRQWKVSGGDMYCSAINCTAIIIFCFDFQWKVKEGDMYFTATIIVCFGLTMEGSRRVANPLLT